MLFVFLILILIYVVTMLQLIVGFKRIPTFHFRQQEPITFFSIIVPFRNESANLPAFLESIKNLNYPVEQFELLFIDDFSEDDSVRKIFEWRMQNGKIQTTLLENIHRSHSPKKDAISRAIPIVQQEWVITTDADCRVPENWLLVYDQYIRENQVKMIAAPVIYDTNHSFLQRFQYLDLLSLQGTTIGSFGLGLGFMCNGANFCYTKTLFQELHGFSGNKKIASGDDVFLLQKAVKKHKEQVHFLKSRDALVLSKPEAGWIKLLRQRIRWASKTGMYQSLFGKDLAVIVFLGNLSIVAGFFASFLNHRLWPGMALLFLLKFIVDTTLLHKTQRFVTKKRMHYLFLSSILYPFFCVLVAVFSLFGEYEWKGRQY